MPRGRDVFSAHAEVVPFLGKISPNSGSILRARGGSSDLKQRADALGVYSPRTRR